MKNKEKLSPEIIAEKSIQLALMDALSNGLPKEKSADYMKTNAFLNAAKNYQKLFKEL